jgi:hypothetical protein
LFCEGNVCCAASGGVDDEVLIGPMCWRCRGDPAGFDSQGCSRCDRADTQASWSAVCQEGEGRIASGEADLRSRGERRQDQRRRSARRNTGQGRLAVYGRTRRVMASHLAERAGTLAVNGYSVTARTIGDAGRPLEVRDVRMVVNAREPEELDLGEECGGGEKPAQAGGPAAMPVAPAKQQLSNSREKFFHGSSQPSGEAPFHAPPLRHVTLRMFAPLDCIVKGVER